MPVEPYSRMRDVLFGYDTDIHFENDDIMTTTGIDYIEREVYKLLITEPGEWQADQTIGCAPSRFLGEPNTRETAKEMEQFVEEGLRITVAPAQVKVRAVPVGYEKILLFVDIFSSDFEVVSIPFEFSFVTGLRKVERVDARVEKKAKSSLNYAINDITNLKRPNKYWSRLRNTYLTQT